MAYILSYDLGTGGTKASLYDEAGRSLASSSPARMMFCSTVYWGNRLKFWNTRPK